MKQICLKQPKTALGFSKPGFLKNVKKMENKNYEVESMFFHLKFTAEFDFDFFFEINLTVFTVSAHLRWNFVTRGHYMPWKGYENNIFQKTYYHNQS